MKRLEVKNLGPLANTQVRFGDLTVLVGPQASGKSVFLQLVKLLLDKGPVLAEFERFNIEWDNQLHKFLDLYFGEGMSSIYSPGATRVTEDGKALELKAILRSRRGASERCFLIPAQRVIALREGLTRPFTDYRSGDPFAVRQFSERLHYLVQSEFAKGKELFPVSNRLKKEFRDKIATAIFGKFGLRTDPGQFEKRLVLSQSGREGGLPYLVWSSGQREFVPLLLGLYWLMPPAKVARRNKWEWVLVEEIEMGLHPNGISVVMLLILDLLKRGYKVCLSTHSPHVLDIVWALRIFQKEGGKPQDLLDLFELPSNASTKELAEAVLRKEAYVYYFGSDGESTDISALDPSSESDIESGWGGITEFSGRVGEVVSRVVRRSEGRGA